MKGRIMMAAALAVVLSACTGGGGNPFGTPISWSDSALGLDLRGKNNQRFTYLCPPGGTANTIWGTNTYTDDSRICTAAVHVGRISLALGGTVTIEILPGQAAYTGSTKNGITSLDYGVWGGSFAFRDNP